MNGIQRVYRVEGVLVEGNLNERHAKGVIESKRNGQNHGFARAIEISRFFRDLILVEASEMNNTVGFIFISASKRFLFKLVCFQHLNSMQSVSSTF
jgi:hypothetical protein